MKFSALVTSVALVSSVSAVPLTIERATLNKTAGISEALLSKFKLFANFTAASYCPTNENATAGSLITCPDSTCPQVEADTATIIVGFGGSNDTSIANIKGFIALDPARSLIVISFAGSGNTIRNWLTDFSFIQVPYTIPGCTSCTIHSGFATGWAERRTIVLDAVNAALATHPDYSIVVTGHSIGGALATLAAAELRSTGLKIDTYTFGSPRVGNTAFASFVTAQEGTNFRMTHENDPVPQLPPTWIGYQHTSPEFWLTGGNATSDVYEREDVVVCQGLGSEGCNSGTGLVPIEGEAHNHYLGVITGCQGPIEW